MTLRILLTSLLGLASLRRSGTHFVVLLTLIFVSGCSVNAQKTENKYSLNPSKQQIAAPVKPSKGSMDYDAAMKQCVDLPNGTQYCYSSGLSKNNNDIRVLIEGNKDYASYLLKVEQQKGLPPYSLVATAVAESSLGEVRGCNRHGYCGPMQFGKREWKKYGRPYGPSPSDLHASANAAADLQNDYLNSVGMNGTKDPVLNYIAHQQGPVGVVTAVTIKNGGQVSPHAAAQTANNMCNNLPDKFTAGTCVKTRKGKVARRGVPAKQVVDVYMAVWTNEIHRIRHAATAVLSKG